MTKCIVETTGDFMFSCPNGETIEAHRACVVSYTPFVDHRLARGDLRTFASGLPMKASDDDFMKTVAECEGNFPMAVEAYCAELGVDTKGEPIDHEKKPESKAERKAREKAEAEAKAKAEAEAEAKAKAEAEAKAKEEADAKAKAEADAKAKAK